MIESAHGGWMTHAVDTWCRLVGLFGWTWIPDQVRQGSLIFIPCLECSSSGCVRQVILWVVGGERGECIQSVQISPLDKRKDEGNKRKDISNWIANYFICSNSRQDESTSTTNQSLWSGILFHPGLSTVFYGYLCCSLWHILLDTGKGDRLKGTLVRNTELNTQRTLKQITTSGSNLCAEFVSLKELTKYYFSS